MKFTKISVVALLFFSAFVAVIASSSMCNAEAKENKSSMKCNDVAVKHAKTPMNQYVCPIAIWAAEVVSPDGELIDEAVTIWQTADGNYWIVKQLQVCDESDPKAVKTKAGAVMKPMSKEEAKNDQSHYEYDMVKCAHQCKKKTIKDCEARGHVKSVDGKVTMCSGVDAKKSKGETETLDNQISDSSAFLVIAEN